MKAITSENGRSIMGTSLVERAICHASDTVEGIAPASLDLPTPCSAWDLRALLHHVTDSLHVLEESIVTGRIAPEPPRHREHEAADPVACFRDRAQRILESWPRAGTRHDTTTMADRCLPTQVVLPTVALEIAVHSWDISHACGERRPIPASLALELLFFAPLLVDGTTRPDLFADPVPVSPGSSPGDRLVAFLGRNPAA
jgi:uncharacterized protein (TIGR03086 family)